MYFVYQLYLASKESDHAAVSTILSIPFNIPGDFLLCGATVFPALLENTAAALLFLRDEMLVFFQVQALSA